MTSLVASNTEYELVADICKSSYFDFFKEFWETVTQEKLVLNWHLEFLCEELQKVAERVFEGKTKLYDLVINISPGTTKSTIASVLYTPWMWTRMPSLRSINGSHTHELVLDLSRKARDVILSEKYQACFPGIELREDQNTKGYYANTEGGSRFSCTVGGKTPTGMHGHIHVVDDPIDPKKALSEAEIKNATDWMNETLSTRKVDKAVTPLLLVMQRLSQHDPAGSRIEKGGNLRHINLPAEETEYISPPELRKFYKHGLMDPIRLSREVLDELKQEGEYFYSGQFLQSPVPPGGGMFKTDRLHMEDFAPDYSSFKKMIRYWDKAGSLKRGSSWTVGVLMGVTDTNPPQYWILDVNRFKEESSKREKEIVRQAHRDGERVKIGVEQEGASSGKESAENTVARLGGFKVKIYIPKGEKELRADPLSSQVNAGNVYVKKAHWNREFIEELKYFPYSRYKDQVDAAAGSYNALFKLRKRIGAF